MKTSGTPLAELERLHDRSLVENSLKAWQALTKALEKEKETMEMVLDVGSLSEAWLAATKIAAGTEEAEYNRVNREFESLEIGVSEPVAEYFARVHVILMKLARHQVTTPAREIKRTVLGSLTSRFPDEVRLYAMKAETLDLKDLENGLAPAESFQSDQKRWNPLAHALAVARAGSGRTGTGGGARARGRQGRRSGKRHDVGSRSQPATGLSATDAPWAARSATPMAATPAAAISAVTTGGASPGLAGRDHLPNSSTGAGRLTSRDNNMGEKISRIGTSGACVSGAARRSVSRRVHGNSKHASISAAASSAFGTIFRSSCRAVRLLPSSPVDITRIQRWIFDLVKLRASAATRQLCTCSADATTAQT